VVKRPRSKIIYVMKSIYKYTLVFFVIYLTARITSIMILYSWTAFGGRNSMNIFQKIIYFFFNFPSEYIKMKSLILAEILNATFWSLVFYVIKKIYKVLKYNKIVA